MVVLSWDDVRAGAAWARVLGAEYEQPRRARLRGRDGVLDQYGSTNPTEFSAVGHRVLLRGPAQLKKKHPVLCDELKGLFHRDPEPILRDDPRS